MHFPVYSLHSMNIDHPNILDILYNYHVSNQGKWLTSTGFQAILVCTGTMKQIKLQNPHSRFKILSTDLKHFIKLYISSLWQIFWDFSDTSELFSIENKVNKS